MFETQRKKAVSLANRHLIGFEEKWEMRLTF